jgi:hypothetical protein
MTCQKRPRKSYKPILTWVESNYTEDNKEEWRYLTLSTNLDGRRYTVNIRTRHKCWGEKQRTCDIDLYQDLGGDQDYYEPLAFGPYYEKILNFDPMRYKHEALAWAEELLVTPMRSLSLGLTT